MILFPDVAQFVYHHEIDGLLRAVHEEAGKAEAVPGTAAAVAFPGGGNLHASGDESRFPAPEGHFFRQNGGSLCPQSGNFRFGGGRGSLLRSQTLTLQMLCNPSGVLFHEAVNAFLRHAHGGADDYPAVPGDFESQRFSAGTDEFVIFHAIKIPCPAENVNRKVTVGREKGTKHGSS